MLHRQTLRTFASFCFITCALIGCASSDASSGAPDDDSPVGSASESLGGDSKREVNDVLLVHGAWADGSSWTNVIKVLQQRGYSVSAVQLREQSLEDDTAIVRHSIDAIPRPLVLVGHSYGGFVITQASTGAANVSALVYIAAFGPDAGEAVGSLAAAYPPTPALANLVIDDQGNATIPTEDFVQHFAADVPEADARVLAATQHPIAASILGTPSGEPGWKTIPSYYQVSLKDEAIDPGLERMFADRMGAETIELDVGHLSLVTQPRAVARLIGRAASSR